MKTTTLITLTALALLATATASSAQNATLTTPVNAESSVQYSNPPTVTGFTNYVTGYNKVKYSATTTSCKTYFKFDFTGLNPNTNYDLKFSWTQVNNNSAQHMSLWALNQAYPGFVPQGGATFPTAANPSLTWGGAQANDPSQTANDMLTAGSFTASVVNSVTDPGASSGTFGGTLPAPWGQYLINNQVVIVLANTNSADNSNGARLAIGATTAIYQPLTGGTLPPAISSIPPQTVTSMNSSGNINFTVSDPQDAASSLNNITVSLGNANVTLISSNIVNNGGGSRTLTLTPTNNLAPGTTATVTVTVAVTDSAGNSASTSFLLTVPPFVSLPVLYSGTTNVNSFNPTNMLLGAGSITIPFTVVDTNITASQLVVSATVPYSTNLGTVSVTQSGGGAGVYTNNCTVTVPANAGGVGVVSLSLGDPVNLITQKVSLAVMVLPDSSYAVYDTMTYQPSTSYASSSGHQNLATVSAGLWPNRSTGGSVDIITTVTPSSGGVVPVGQPVIRGSGSGNADQIQLVGGPFAPGSHKVIFASVNAQWADISAYGGNAYYPSNSTGAFLQFAADASASSNVMAAVCTVVNPSGYSAPDGQFYLGLYQGTSVANPPITNSTVSLSIPDVLQSVIINPAVNIAVSYDVDTGYSALWVNQSSSASPNVTTTNILLNAVNPTNQAVNCAYLVLRQNAGMGNIVINSASVKVVTKSSSVTTPDITKESYAAGNFVITYTGAPGSGGLASVVGSSTVNGTYSTVPANVVEGPAGTFTATITAPSGSQNFYRILQQPSTGSTPTVNFPF